MNTQLWGALIVVAMLGASHWFAYQQGREQVKAEDEEAVASMALRLKALTVELERAKGKRELVYRDRVKVIHEQTDDCLERLMPVPAIQQLRADDPVPP